MQACIAACMGWLLVAAVGMPSLAGVAGFWGASPSLANAVSLIELALWAGIALALAWALAMAPKADAKPVIPLPGESPESRNAAILAENAALVLASAQVLTQPEALQRWFEAALANKQLRRHLTPEQIAMYERMSGLLHSISAKGVYDDLVAKLRSAGYADSGRLDLHQSA